jgi:hypothetical protein
MNLQPTTSSYSQINHAIPQNQTDSPASGLTNSAQKAAQRFTLFCNDPLGRFLPPQDGHAPFLVVSDKTAKQLKNKTVGVGEIWVSEKRLTNIFSKVHQPLEPQLYSASELTDFIYKSDLKIDGYFSCAIYGFFQDALENTRFRHPEWIQDKPNGRIGICSSLLMEWIKDLVESRTSIDSQGNHYVNLFLLNSSHNTQVQYTCIKMERGILKYSSSLEPLIQKLLDFQPSRELLNHALKDRKITIMSATPSSPVGYHCNYDHRTMLISDRNSNETQLGYILRGVSNFLADGSKEQIQNAYKNGQLSRDIFTQKTEDANCQALKLCNNVINEGIEGGRWSEEAKSAIVNS